MIIIYDSSGKIWYNGIGEGEPIGLPFLNVEIPNGKYVESVDVSKQPHTPVFKDYPKTDVQILREAVEKLNEKVAGEAPIMWIEGMRPELGKKYTDGNIVAECIEVPKVLLYYSLKELVADGTYFRKVG